MKQTVKYLSIAALVIVGAMSCNSLKEEIPGPDANDGTVTFTTTVGLDASTKALTSSGVKTFAAGDQIAVIYKNSSNQTVKAVSTALVAGDITNSGKNATFTVTLTNPKASSSVRYIYPATMAITSISTSATIDDAGTVNFNALATQNGSLATLAANLDLAVFDGSLTAGAELPASATLTNKLAILALTLKNSSGDSDLTSTITGLTLSDGTNSYAVSRSAAAGPIYVAIRPTETATITITAVTGSSAYTKSLTGKTYAASNGYDLSWRLTQLEGALGGYFTVSSAGKKVLFSKGNLQATYSSSSWSWAFAANQWDYIGRSSGNVYINGNGTVSGSPRTMDLFGWVGASSTVLTTAPAMYGVSNSTTNNDYGNKNNEALKSDWGNTVGTGWRTLTSTEWSYLLNTRGSGSTVNGTANARYTLATINTNGTAVNGVIIFPNGITVAAGEASSWGTINGSGSAWDTKCTTSQWDALAAKGCVFLPAGGSREKDSVSNYGTYGAYWTSTSSYSMIDYIHFSGSSVVTNDGQDRKYGCSVRLIYPAN